MPCLDEWSALEEDYLTSLSEAIQSMLNASFQLPVGANVRVRSFILCISIYRALRKPKIIILSEEHMMDGITL